MTTAESRNFRLLKMLPIAILALSGCSDWERKFPPAKDYCERLQKNIPENEKKAIILTKMYYGSQSPDYIYQHVIHIIDKNATRSDVHKEIRKYIEKNPLCCQILRPDHLGNQVFNGDYWTDDVYHRDFKWGYMADFFVFTEPSWVSGHYSLGDNFEEKDLRRGFVLMVNNCAETQAFFRG